MKRRIYPGEEWLYYKIYLSPSIANRVLIEIIHPFIEKLSEHDLISEWFFIRYWDPDFHIRLRLKLNSLESIGKIMIVFYNALKNELENHTIPKIQLDTYNREIERYGLDTIENCEQFFYQDSEYVHKFILNNPTEWNTIMQCIKWISQFYKKLEFSNIEISKLVDTTSNSYNNELKLNIEQIAEINSLYRKSKLDILKSINIEDYDDGWTYGNLEWVKQSKNQEHIVPSLIHMHVNRIFSSNQRVYECFIYNLLKKGLQTLIYKPQ